MGSVFACSHKAGMEPKSRRQALEHYQSSMTHYLGRRKRQGERKGNVEKVPEGRSVVDRAQAETETA